MAPFLPGMWMSVITSAGGANFTAARPAPPSAAVQSSPPSLVVTDIHMPGINGAAVISELKRRNPQIAVIAISGLFNSGHGLDADAARALGAARVLAKPFKRAELLRALAEILGPPVP